MDDNIIIRDAKEQDFKKIHKLIIQVHKLHVRERNDIYKDINPLDLEEFKEELSNNNNIYLVAELKNEIVGICLSQIKEISNNKIMKNRKIIHISNICVDEPFRKNGIGKKLYNQTIQLAKEKKIDTVELMVWGFNENAIKFYKDLGMTVKNITFEQKIT